MKRRQLPGYGKHQYPILLALLMISASLACSGSQQSTQTGASSVAAQAYAAMTQIDWEAYSHLLHPDASAEFKATIMRPIDAIYPPDSVYTEADSTMILGTPFSILGLRAMEPETFFHTILKSVFENVPQLSGTFQTLGTEVVGEVKETADVVHVVVRTNMTIGGTDVREMNVLTAEKYAGEWKVHLSTKTRGLAQLVQQALAQQLG